MHIRARSISQNDTRLQMSSMVDVVFLLLFFFVMTFQVTAVEGDFAISPPGKGAVAVEDVLDRPRFLHVHLFAAEDGSLASLSLDGVHLADTFELHRFVRQLVERDRAMNLAIELTCDNNLRYQHTIDAISAIKGHRTSAGQQPLINRITFGR